ncbi:phage N-6-adenine-methyltransferase [Plesiomonas shigelloides subsp. oncorhynchi]|nr:phage N-6-adenine-methyltransferase [Plesiomonas shigelloides]
MSNENQVTESQLFTIEALNRIEAFVWPEGADGAEMHDHDPEAYFCSSSNPKYRKVWHAGVLHPNCTDSLITREQFDCVDGWVRCDGCMPVSGDVVVQVSLNFGISGGKTDFASKFAWGDGGITHWRHRKLTNAYSANLAALKARPACKLKEIGDQWRTPERLYIGINAKFGPFTLDLFTDGDNSKCVNFYTAEQNALLQDWASDLKQFGGSAFANPPYSRESKDNNGEYVTGMRHIIDKALAERDAGARIVFLIKATPSETWWPEEADHIVFIKGRIGFDVPEWFVPEEGSAAKAGAGFASAVAIFDKNWRGRNELHFSR